MKKQIPNDMRAWVNEVVGIRRLLADLNESNLLAKPEWVTKQRAYYEHRLEALLDNPPDVPSRYKWGKIREIINGRNT